MFFSYILKSNLDNTYYYGSTANLDSRLKQHNSGKSKYTKSKRRWLIIFHESFDSRSKAMERERFYKSIDGYKWLKSNNII